MTRRTMAFALLAGMVMACSSSGPSSPDAAGNLDAAGDSFTVENYESWCSVSVNGGSSSTSAVQTVTVPAGTVALVARAASSEFEIGGNMWHHTSGDTGNGEPGTVSGSGSNATSTASATAPATTCVWVCCPFANGEGCTDLPDLCP